jgi:hypothetical protein
VRSVGQLALLALGARTAPAQVVPNRATRYLDPSDVGDARAVWVNPAGLARYPEASFNLAVAVGDPGVAGRLRQLTLGANSRGLSFGYQRDVFADGSRGHTYRVGLAAGHAGLAAGVAAALYRGGTAGTGWDLGILYDWTTSVSLAGVIQNIGEPVVRGSALPITYVPGATLHLEGVGAAISATGRLTAGGVLGYSLGARAGLRQGTQLPLGFVARVDTDRALHGAGFAFGFSLGAQDAAGLIATTPGNLGRIDALDLYGVSTRRFPAARSLRD